MGRYRAASTCRYCWGQGHTQRSCPKMREDAANGDAYAKHKVEQYAQAVKARKCSYCNETGHNKKGCKVRKEHKVVYDLTVNKFRNEMRERALKAGVKVGSLIAVTKRSEPIVAIVEKIAIDDRGPGYGWLNRHFACNEPDQTQEQEADYYNFSRYNNSKGSHFQDPQVFMRSLTGNGLGYWNDEGIAWYDLTNVIDTMENGNTHNFKVVSEA